jgi:hypothetical protein
MGKPKTAQPIGRGEPTPQSEHCHCGKFGGFGFAKRSFCRQHVPDDYWCWPGSQHPIALARAATKAAPVAEPKTTLDLPLMTGRR